MPSATIHRVVAKRVLDKIEQFTDSHDIYLYEVGAVAPDSWRNTAKYKDSDLPKIEKRKYSHFSEDGSYTEHYDVFYEKYKDTLNNPFMFGYFVHLITDNNWREDMFYNCFTEDGSIKFLDGSTLNGEHGVRKEVLYNESRIIAALLCDYFKLEELNPIKDEELSSLPKMSELDYDGINMTIYFINNELKNPVKEEPRVYRLEDFVTGVENCSDFIISELKRYDVIKKKESKH